MARKIPPLPALPLEVIWWRDHAGETEAWTKATELSATPPTMAIVGWVQEETEENLLIVPVYEVGVDDPDTSAAHVILKGAVVKRRVLKVPK